MIEITLCLVSLPNDKKKLKGNILRFINMSKNKRYYARNSSIYQKKFNKQKIKRISKF